MKFLRTAGAGLMLACYHGAAPAAQTATGTILGDVKDSTGGALPGATITAENQANGATRQRQYFRQT